ACGIAEDGTRTGEELGPSTTPTAHSPTSSTDSLSHDRSVSEYEDREQGELAAHKRAATDAGPQLAVGA
ncbi:hypothetical protein V5O48_007037, partial [Marasmius crinis-equi]